MNEKFDMKLVIDAVTTPLLHARLSQANSYRERAAILRSLAEANLRGDQVTSEPDRQVAVRAADNLAPSERYVVRPSASGEPVAVARVDIDSSDDRVRIVSIDENGGPDAHDADQISTALGAYF